MQPRPTIATSANGFRRCAMRTSPACRRPLHFQAVWGFAKCTRAALGETGRATISENVIKGFQAPSARCGSSAAAAATKSHHSSKSEHSAVPRTTNPQARTIRAQENVNPPSILYAPTLSVPPREPTQSFIKYVWRAGRAYLSFYKAGVSNVRQTSKLASSLRKKASQAKDGDMSEVLTRAEWQTIRRSRRDMLRLPAFGLIFLVFGEWTPLLVMYITPLIPEACRIPSQAKRELSKAENRRHDRLRRAATDALRLMSRDRPITRSMSSAELSTSHFLATCREIQKTDPLHLTHYELLLASSRYDCHSRMLDLLRITPPKFWLLRNVRKHLSYLCKDDALIQRDGGFQALEKREVERACIERGFDVLNKREDEMRKALYAWFTR